ncbi:MAG: peptidyl-prolyl cis-trans isomerase [Verrucomicrobiota bacterium]
MKFFSFISAALFFSAGFSRAALVNGINAVVNDKVITYQEVEGGVEQLDALLIRQYRNEPQLLEQKRQQLRTDQIERLVENQLILADFKSAGYNLPESFIDDAVQEEIRKNFYGDRARLTKTLQSEGVTFEEFRKQQRERIIITYLRRQNSAPEKIVISPFKIETYYKEHQDDFKAPDEVKLRMIVLNQAADAEPGAAKKLAEEVLKKVDEGASFAEMASIYSEGSQKAQGGDRGWVERSYLKKELADAAFSLKAGQRSGVIELEEACYLLQVDEIRPARIRTLEEVRGEVEKTLVDQETARLTKKWMDRLKSKSFVRYY